MSRSDPPQGYPPQGYPPPGQHPQHYQPATAPRSEPLTLPSWTLPVLMGLFGSVGGGAVGVGVGRTTAESPAAIVTNLEHIQEAQRRQEGKIDMLETKISDLKTGMGDRWKKTDMTGWIQVEFSPLEDEVMKLDRRVQALESDIEDLERQIRRAP